MTTIARARLTWDGGVPGGGISTFYVPSVSTDLSALKTFFTSCASFLPPSVVINVPNNVDLLDMNSGRLTGNQPCAGSGTVTGTGNSAYSNGVGCRIVWQTGTVVNFRMLKGSTFLAPLGQGFASSDGSLNDSMRTSLQGFINTLIAADVVRVYHRPKKGTFTGGTWAPATSGSVPDRVTALRSRRY